MLFAAPFSWNVRGVRRCKSELVEAEALCKSIRKIDMEAEKCDLLTKTLIQVMML